MDETLHKKILILLFCIALVVSALYLLYPAGKDVVDKVRGSDANRVEHGKEVIYSYIGRGNLSIAEAMLDDRYELSRFEPIEISPITWEEDPYDDIYWRFNFYNLEPVRHLLYAWLYTGEEAYKDKVIEITESFIDDGMDSQYAWDKHGTAFRTMTLINVWAKLQASAATTDSEEARNFNAKLLAALEAHGKFLAAEKNYERGYNHGLDQAAALYLLAVNFPELPLATTWLDLSLRRLDESVDGIIDEDGVLVENAPYYHFYVLDKLWEINAYLEAYGHPPSVPTLAGKVDDMIAYGTHVLQPNLDIPTIGASLGEEVRLAGIYREMASDNSELRYVLTKGASGKQPKQRNLHFPDGGQTIMRSGWGQGAEFENQTQLIFDVGSFRTNHSDLDALSFHLYSNGLAVMPDAGLYAYEGPYRTYFHGTRAHNTVVVDGQDQLSAEVLDGSVEKVHAGVFEEGTGYVYQSGSHELYDDVIHKRAIALIEGSTVVIFDVLESTSEHEYEQMFHLAPGAEVHVDGTNLFAIWNSGQSLSIRQLQPKNLRLDTKLDEHNPPAGLCSPAYTTAVPCHEISYAQTGTSTSFVTIIELDNETPTHASLSADATQLTIETAEKKYDINVSKTMGVERNIAVTKHFDTNQMFAALTPLPELNQYSQWYQTTTVDEDGTSYSPGFVSFDSTERSLELLTPVTGLPVETIRPTNLNLKNRQLYFKAKVSNADNLSDLTITLSNNNWQKQAEYDLRKGVFGIKEIYRDNVWYQYNLSETTWRDPQFGAWEKSDPSFNWSVIDGVKLTAESDDGTTVIVDIKDFAYAPQQEEGRAVIIFDDGWKTVLDAANIMHKYDLKGNVPMIASVTGRSSYLSLYDLKRLQNVYDWDIVNHSTFHNNATLEYVDTNDLAGYEEDISNALAYLIKNDINSAPNWYVYPHGKTSPETKSIISKYYTFARSTVDGPESFPFAEPHDVKIMSVYHEEATVADVKAALADAKRHNQTIMLMFHKFSKDTPSVFTEWQLSEFEEILQYITEQDIPVLTLSELDEINGVPQTEFVLQEAELPQLVLDISRDNQFSILDFFTRWIEN